jgi:hypothetical protein
MKNKPDPALLRSKNLSNEIKKRVPKSRETISLIKLQFDIKVEIFADVKFWWTWFSASRFYWRRGRENWALDFQTMQGTWISANNARYTRISANNARCMYQYKQCKVLESVQTMQGTCISTNNARYLNQCKQCKVLEWVQTMQGTQFNCVHHFSSNNAMYFVLCKQ